MMLIFNDLGCGREFALAHIHFYKCRPQLGRKPLKLRVAWAWEILFPLIFKLAHDNCNMLYFISWFIPKSCSNH